METKSYSTAEEQALEHARNQYSQLVRALIARILTHPFASEVTKQMAIDLGKRVLGGDDLSKSLIK